MATTEQPVVTDEEVVHDEESRSKHQSDWRVNRKDSIKKMMWEKKSEKHFDLDKDIYSLITMCPVASFPFVFSIGVVLLKLAIYAILVLDITIDKRINNERIATVVVKFLLIPVSVAMQEDLMSAFSFFANGIYCPSMMDVSISATKSKLYFSYFMRTIDGIFSLYVNFTVVLGTPDTLGVFLNFAALQFLQSIDDVFYELIEKGFLGDPMEHWASLCAKVTIGRRHGDDDKKILSFRISHLDTILTLMTMSLCFIAWVTITAAEYNETFGLQFYGPKNITIDV